jgi:hypothetical protein
MNVEAVCKSQGKIKAAAKFQQNRQGFKNRDKTATKM